MTTPYLAQQPVTDFGHLISDIKYATELSANTEQTFEVPGNAARYKAVFSFGQSDVWFAVNKTATIPSGSFAATDSEMNPPAREVKAGDVLHFITSATSQEIGVAFYSI